MTLFKTTNTVYFKNQIIRAHKKLFSKSNGTGLSTYYHHVYYFCCFAQLRVKIFSNQWLICTSAPSFHEKQLCNHREGLFPETFYLKKWVILFT